MLPRSLPRQIKIASNGGLNGTERENNNNNNDNHHLESYPAEEHEISHLLKSPLYPGSK